jgi:two-component system phosphate regulon sensor histidine kinase PhoR
MDAEVRGQTSTGRGTLLALATAGAAGMLGVAFAGSNALAIACFAAAALLALALYVSRSPNAGVLKTLAATPDASAEMLPGIARDVFESLADPIIMLGTSGHVVFANRASQALLGATIERKHISAVLRTPSVLEAVDRVIAGGEGETVAFSFLVPVERHYEAFVTRASRESSPARGLVLIQLHDFTAVRRAEQMRADFVANASHELRTPLAAVGGFIDTLRGHAKDDAEARTRFLEIMSVETGRMRRLIDDLLSLTRIELNEHNPPAGVTDLTSIVRGAAAALAPLAAADGVTIEVAPQDPLPVTGDRDELTQVFQNLIHNAIKYGRSGGRVRVRFGRVPGVSRHGVELVFAAVEDEGEGIPRDLIPRLTERFYRVDVKRSRERGGTGLGLAIVKHILNRHQGRLQIESTPGKGSTFTVLLPSAARSTQESDEPIPGVIKML